MTPASRGVTFLGGVTPRQRCSVQINLNRKPRFSPPGRDVPRQAGLTFTRRGYTPPSGVPDTDKTKRFLKSFTEVIRALGEKYAYLRLILGKLT